MLKILFAVRAMVFLTGAALAAASKPIFEPVPMADVSADFDVMPEISVDVDLMAYAEDQPVDCATHELVSMQLSPC